MHALGRDRTYLHAHPEEEVQPAIVERYSQLIAERMTGRPTQYITGHQEFWGLDFEVTPDVLIPRPETEHIVECVLGIARRQSFAKDSPLRIVDVGTGSGCISLALASEFRRAILFGLDISRAALAVASRNAERLGMPERVRFLESDLLEQLFAADLVGTFDFVVSNPPYVGKNDVDKTAAGSSRIRAAARLGRGLGTGRRNLRTPVPPSASGTQAGRVRGGGNRLQHARASGSIAG